MTVVRSESRMPKWVSTHTIANVASAKIHHGTSTPEAVWIVSDSRKPRNPMAPAGPMMS